MVSTGSATVTSPRRSFSLSGALCSTQSDQRADQTSPRGHLPEAGARWEHDGDRIRSVEHRRGHQLISIEGALGERISHPPPILGRPHRNVRASSGLAIPKVVAFTPRDRVIEVRRANVEVRISGSDRDPLHEMGFGKVLAARLHRVDLGAGSLPIPVAAVSPFSFLRYLLIRSH